MERADKRKHHYIYKTTCMVSGRWYIGMHSTDNLDDGYIGSGKRLWHSINKHGKENHVCEILEFLPDRKSLAAREKELVSQETLKEESCMNLKVGGEGGGRFWSDEHQFKCSSAGGKNGGKVTGAKNWNENRDKIVATRKAKGNLATYGMLGKTHSEETRKQMSESGKGENNSNYGKRNKCVSKDGITKRIPLDEVNAYLTDGWVLGMKK